MVRTLDGNIEIDTSGKKNGRGAYLCPARECWEAALKGNQLERTLRSSLKPEDREQLVKYGEELLKGVN